MSVRRQVEHTLELSNRAVSMDRLTSKQTPEGTLNDTYDNAGNLASMQSADGAVNVSCNWDSLNRLSTVVDNHLGTTTYTTGPKTRKQEVHFARLAMPSVLGAEPPFKLGLNRVQ